MSLPGEEARALGVSTGPLRRYRGGGNPHDARLRVDRRDRRLDETGGATPSAAGARQRRHENRDETSGRGVTPSQDSRLRNQTAPRSPSGWFLGMELIPSSARVYR